MPKIRLAYFLQRPGSPPLSFGSLIVAWQNGRTKHVAGQGRYGRWMEIRSPRSGWVDESYYGDLPRVIMSREVTEEQFDAFQNGLLDCDNREYDARRITAIAVSKYAPGLAAALLPKKRLKRICADTALAAMRAVGSVITKPVPRLADVDDTLWWLQWHAGFDEDGCIGSDPFETREALRSFVTRVAVARGLAGNIG